jgi:F-type H+-transporting ATPase subunit b
MTRQPVLALGLLSLALWFVPASRSSADEPQAKDAHAPAPVAEAKHDAASGAPGHAAEGGHSSAQPDILEPQAPLAIWTVVVFGVLLAILAKFAWKPMMKALHDREEHIEHCLLEAEKARNEAERMMIENQKNLARAAEQARALLDEAKQSAESLSASIVQKAQAEAEASLERGKREIETARDQALTEIFSKTADLAIAVAGKVLARDLTEADHRRLVETAMSELPAIANGQGARS